jgi:hypothetical protein
MVNESSIQTYICKVKYFKMLPITILTTNEYDTLLHFINKCMVTFWWWEHHLTNVSMQRKLIYYIKIT